jgi:hypothetical protein
MMAVEGKASILETLGMGTQKEGLRGPINPKGFRAVLGKCAYQLCPRYPLIQPPITPYRTIEIFPHNAKKPQSR